MSKFTHLSVRIHDNIIPFSSPEKLIEYLSEWSPTSFFADRKNQVEVFYEGLSYGHPFCLSDLAVEIEVSHEKIKEIVEKVEKAILNSSEKIKNRQVLSGDCLFYPKDRAKYIIDGINHFRFVWKNPKDIKFEQDI